MTAIIRTRLGLGIEPVDAIDGNRVTRKLEVQIESKHGKRAMQRHETGRYTVPLSDRLRSPLVVRVYDRRRGYVPRRLEISLPDSSIVRTGRIHTSTLFPGVAWDIPSNSTGLRARVTRGLKPVRWAQVEASRPGSATVVLRTRADDRGEFLLVLGPRTVSLTELGPLELTLRVYGPTVEPDPPASDEDDPLWDLPVEDLSIPGADAGELRPAGWGELHQHTFNFTPGRVDSDQATFKL